MTNYSARQYNTCPDYGLKFRTWRAGEFVKREPCFAHRTVVASAMRQDGGQGVSWDCPPIVPLIRCASRRLSIRLMRGLSLRGTILAVAGASLFGIAPASASAFIGATTFVQSAKGGGFHGHQLTLRGVGRSVRWQSSLGKQSGVVSFPLLKRQLFPRNATLTADLHVAGRRGVVRLLISRPRYSARRGTVSYRVKRLSGRRIPLRFGRVSLSILWAPGVGRSVGDYSCQTQLQDNTAYGLQPIDSSKSELDTWANLSPPTAVIGSNDAASWESDGALFKGCSNSVVWKLVPDPNKSNPPTPPSATVTLSVIYPNDGFPTYTCKPSGALVYCKQTYATRDGVVYWDLDPVNPR